MNRLFDEDGMLNVSDIVINNPSYMKIMEDGIVTDEELQEQSETTMAALHHLESICNAEQQEAILKAISEMGVLFSVYHHYQLQNAQ